MRFKLMVLAAFAALAISAQAQNARPVQTFQTSAGPVKITPIYHAALLIEAGGKIFISILPNRLWSPACRPQI